MNNNTKSDTKQLHYSKRTFDIVPRAIMPRNFNLERGIFNQVSEYENPQKFNDIKQTLHNDTINNYKNPYVICQNDFCNDIKSSRKAEKMNRTNIYGERLYDNLKYINNRDNNQYIDRFYQIDQQNLDADKYKSIKVPNEMNFQEYMKFKKNISK